VEAALEKRTSPHAQVRSGVTAATAKTAGSSFPSCSCAPTETAGRPWKTRPEGIVVTKSPGATVAPLPKVTVTDVRSRDHLHDESEPTEANVVTSRTELQGIPVWTLSTARVNVNCSWVKDEMKLALLICTSEVAVVVVSVVEVVVSVAVMVPVVVPVVVVVVVFSVVFPVKFAVVSVAFPVKFA